MLSKYLREMIESVASPNRKLFISNSSANGSDTLEVYQNDVQIANTGSYTETITLPSVAEAKGLTFAFYAADVGGGVTVQDNNDSMGWSDQTISKDDGSLVLQSNGKSWLILEADLS